MGMDGGKGGGFPNPQKTHMRRTGTTHAETGRAIQARSGSIKLRDWRDPKSKGRTRTMASCNLLLHDTFRNREELRHLRQGTISSREVPPSLENLPGRGTTSDHHCYVTVGTSARLEQNYH